MQGPEVRSGDVPQPILLKEGQQFNFTIRGGVSTEDTVGVNYDDFVNDVEVGDILLVDGKYEFFFLLLITCSGLFIVHGIELLLILSCFKLGTKSRSFSSS